MQLVAHSRGTVRTVAAAEAERAARDVVQAFVPHLQVAEELRLVAPSGRILLSAANGLGPRGIEQGAICGTHRARLAVRCSVCRDWRLPFCMACATRGLHADRFFAHRSDNRCGDDALGLREDLP